MLHPSNFVECLLNSGVDFFTGVPDSLLKSFCAYVTDNCGESHVIAANEGGAVGLAAGHYLATGKPALVYMQNFAPSAGDKSAPAFVEIKVAKGARNDLGRPKEPPQANKALFMKTLES